jgi:hypothetical protein
MGTAIFTLTRAAIAPETGRPVTESLRLRPDGKFDYYSELADNAALRFGKCPTDAVLSAQECARLWPGYIDRITMVARWYLHRCLEEDFVSRTKTE